MKALLIGIRIAAMIPYELFNSLNKFRAFISFPDFLQQFANISLFPFHNSIAVSKIYKLFA